MKLIALNLPRELLEDELKDLFTPFGEVAACSLVLDKETSLSKGFGFVEMESDDEANAAIAQLHGSKIGKNKIRVKPAE